MDHDGRLRELSDLVKYNNICMLGVPKDEEKDKAAGDLLNYS